MDKKDAEKRQAELEQLQGRIQKVSDAHELFCEKINSAVKSIDEALATGFILDKAINAGLDSNLRLGKRLRLPSVIHDLMTAKYKLSIAVKLSKSIAPTQFQAVQESLTESEPNFE